LITPKGCLWSGEDNTSPQIKEETGKNVDDLQSYFTEAIATVLAEGSVAFFSFVE
jgi:hypothetical protein